jgi:pantoate kinase
MLILDLDASKREKIETIKLLMAEAFRGIRVAGLEDIYAFIKDPEFAQLIEKHFCFSRVEYPGDLLLRRLD